MNQEKQPEALMLADFYDKFDDAISMQSAGILRLLHNLTESQSAELAAEAARTAEEKLRADQMTEQHRMQANMRKEIEQKLASLQEELSSRDTWLAECRDAFSLPAVNTELDHHFCSAMTDPSEVPAYVVAQAKSIEAQLSAIGAGGVEKLRKREQARGQTGFEAWWRDQYPSFACHAPGIWEMAMHHAAQPARECLQQFEEVDFSLEAMDPLEGFDAILTEYEKTCGRTPDAAMAETVGKVKEMLFMWWCSHREAIAAALQAAPTAPAGVAVPDLNAAAEKIAARIAKNCGSVPQLVFPHLYLGLKDLFASTPTQECGNCFEGKSDLDHTCRKCGGLGAAPAQEHATQLAGKDGEQDEGLAQAIDERDAAFEAVRNRLCGLQRYSFVLDDDGVVRRAQDRTGNWIEFDDAHELFDPVAVDAAIAAQAKGGA